MTSEEAIASIKQEIFSLKMESKKTIRMSRLRKIVSFLVYVDQFYLLAERGTTVEAWENGEFLPDTSDKVMIVFLDEDDIQSYAKGHGFVAADETVLYGTVDAAAVVGITGMFAESGAIDHIKVYPRMPLSIDIPCSLMEVTIPGKEDHSIASEQKADEDQLKENGANDLTQVEQPVSAVPVQQTTPDQVDGADSQPVDQAPTELPDLMPGQRDVPFTALVDTKITEQPMLQEAVIEPVHNKEGHIFSDQPKDAAVTNLVNEIKHCLDMNENRLRRRIDPGLVYNNVHSMMGKLLFANPRMDIYKLESMLNLPGGFLTLYVKDKVSSSISKEKLVALLDYYGLAAYTYQYKKYCNDLRVELRDNPDIDTCEIRLASIHTKEAFELLEINRGKTQEGFYVYGLRFQSTFRIVDVIVSTPLGYVVGKHYELFDLPPLSDDSQPIPESRSAIEVDAVPRERTVEEVLMDSVIAFFKKTESLTVKAAKERYEALGRHPDIQMEFAKYAQTGRPGKIKVREYSANHLIRSLGFSPYDAYAKLCELRDEPDKTLQFLKYRERDPQYNKKKQDG